MKLENVVKNVEQILDFLLLESMCPYSQLGRVKSGGKIIIYEIQRRRRKKENGSEGG